MKLTKSRTAKFVAGLAGFAMALSFVVTPVSTSAATIEELQAMIASLSAQLAALSGTPAQSTGYTFNTNLTLGSKGTDVMNLQKVLNMSADTKLAGTGAGSPGLETSYFGPATRAAVVKFQVKYGITPSVGYVGAITRAKLNSMGGVVVVPPPVVPGNPTGGSMVVTAGQQPSNSLAPQSAARLPFTTFSIQAGASDVTLNSVTVERGGLAQDAVFSGIVLLKSDGTQIGIAKTLNSNHQAMVGEPYVIKAGTTEMFTVAGNMASSLSSYAGQVAALSVVAVNTSATVTGSLPISGAQHTINASLTLGSVTMGTSSYDPGTSQSKEIGTTGYKFSGFRVTAGSAEQIKLWSVRFNQSGSASKTDLDNVKVYVDGTAYDTVVSSDGKYYSANFAGGLLVDKGLSKDIYIQGDIVGSGAAGRTIKFDLYKTTDLYVSGVTYGYGITPPAGANAVVTCSTSQACGTFSTGTPWFQANVVTVSAGSVTSIQKATSVAAANIALNVPNQVLGGFVTDIKGEAITVQSMTFTIATTGTWSSSGGITNITLVDSNGAVVAGPVEEATTCTSGCTITFTDSVTFPIGAKTYTLKGKIPTGAPSGATVVVSATPASWSNITGQTTGNTITLPSTAVAMNTMTVKGPALNVTVDSSPSAQSIVSGGQVLFTNYKFDASQSGEDIRTGSIPLQYSWVTAEPEQLTSCQLFDGATALNTGSNTVNPASTISTAGDVTFTLDSQLVIPKGTIKTLALKCTVSTATSNNDKFNWGVNNPPTATGVASGSDFTETNTDNVGPIMTVATGSFAVSVDSSSPSYALVAGGSTGVTVGVIKFRATNEAVNLTKVGLDVTAVSTGNSNNVEANVGTLYLYNASGTLLGTAQFTGAGTIATSTLNTSLLLPKDIDVLVTVKADFQDIGTGLAGVNGDLVKIDPVNAEGSGVLSGGTLQVGGITAAAAGVRLFNTFPVIAIDNSSTGIPTAAGVADGRLMRFKVTADSHGDVGIYRFEFTLATTTLSVSNIGLFGYTDSGYTTAMSGSFGAGSGQVDTYLATTTSSCVITTHDTAAGSSCTQATAGLTELVIKAATNPVTVPAGTTRYFELRGTISGNATGASVLTKMLSDTAAATSTAAGLSYNFVWSANSTTTATFNSNDWTTGYGIVGFPTSGLLQSRSY